MDQANRIDDRVSIARWRTMPVLWGVVSAVGIALAAAPLTGWIVADQVKALFQPPRRLAGLLADLDVPSPPAAVHSDWTPAVLTSLRARYQADFEIQVGCADIIDNPAARLIALRGLKAEFRQNPALLGHILSCATESDVRLHRNKEQAFIYNAKPENGGPRPTTAASLAAFDRDAAKGESLDPNNAYFPIMRAIGKFEAHEDEIAIAEIERAGRDQLWNDYSTQDIFSHIRVYRAAVGGRGAIERSVIYFDTLLPHVSVLQSMARVGIAKAIESEQRRSPRQALTIRHALIRCGDLMRSGSQSGLGVFGGVSITRTALARPGGELPIKITGNMSDDQLTQLQFQHYATYLRKIGDFKEVAWTKAALYGGTQSRSILAQTEGRRSFGDDGPFTRLICLWMAGLSFLAGALLNLVVGGLSARLPSIPVQRRRLILYIALYVAGAVGMAALVVRWTYKLVCLHSVIENMSGLDAADFSAVNILTYALPFCAIVVPALLVSVVVLYLAAIRRPPRLLSLSRATTAIGLTLLLGYAGIAVSTAHYEAIVNHVIDRSTVAEGSYAAGLLHVKWPAVVR